MTPTRMTTAAAALMLVLGAGAVAAQQAGPRGPWRDAPARAEVSPRAEQRMERRQALRDEAMQPGARAEARPGPRQTERGHPGAMTPGARTERRDSVFAAMDADGDGRVTREEFMAHRMGRQAEGPRAEARQAAKAARFDAMDTDGTGAITREQFEAHAEARMAAREGGRPENRPMRPRR